MNSSSETKKRCPNGSRRDKKTNICIKYPNIKTFGNISDLNISETNNTLSIESLGEDGSILKFYKKQILQSQIFIKEEDIQKAKKKAEKDIRTIIKTMHNIKKDPSIIDRDTKFKKLLKKIRGGNTRKKTNFTPIIKDNNDIFIQESFMKKIESKDITKLEKKIKNLNKKPNESIFDKIWDTLGSHFGAILTIIKTFDIIGFTVMLNNSSGIYPIIFDLICSAIVYILDIWNLHYPEEINEGITLYIKYIIYSFIIVSVPFINGIGFLNIPNNIGTFILGTSGLGFSLYNNFTKIKGEKNKELVKTKRKLVQVLENPNE